MELFVISPNLRFTNPTVALGSTVSDLIEHLSVKEVSRSAITLVKLSSCCLKSGLCWRSSLILMTIIMVKMT